MYKACISSPIGWLQIVCDEEAVKELKPVREYLPENRNDLCEEAVRQVSEYFAGKRREFILPVDPDTTPFRKRVYEALMKVPYGTTISYKQLTHLAGSKAGYRAAGSAMHNNPIMLVIPCHRVISSDGTIGGFGCGTDAKRYLLNLEGIRNI